MKTSRPQTSYVTPRQIAKTITEHNIFRRDLNFLKSEANFDKICPGLNIYRVRHKSEDKKQI